MDSAIVSRRRGRVWVILTRRLGNIGHVADRKELSTMRASFPLVVCAICLAACAKAPDVASYTLTILGHDAATKEWTMESNETSTKQRIRYVATCSSYSQAGQPMDRGADACSFHVGETLAESLKPQSWTDISVDNGGTMAIISGEGSDQVIQLLNVKSAHVVEAPR